MDNSLKKLIFKLTKSEKDYFTKYSKLYKETSDSHYLTLYNTILNNGGINLEELNKKTGYNNLKRNFSIEKERLMEKILSSLINYNYESSYKWKIQKDINYIQVLIDKELNDKAQKYLIRAKKNAYKYEEFELLIQIISFEIILCFKNGFICDYEKLRELEDEQKKIYKNISMLNSLLTIKAELQKFQFSEDVYHADLNNFIKKYGQSPKTEESELKSIRIKSIWLYNKGIYSFIINDYDSSFKHQFEYYQIYKQYPYLFSRKEVMQLINNFLYSCCLNKNEVLFNNILSEFLEIKNLTKEESNYIQKAKYCRTLELFHQLAQYKEAEILAIESEKYIELNSLSFNNFERFDFQFNIIRAYVENNNYLAALRISQKKYKCIGYEYNSSIFKLFEFIAHYKLSNFENLLYSVNSWAKTIRSKRNQFPIEKVLIKFFRSTCNKVTNQERKQLISNTIIQLRELEKSKQKYFINHFFDFASWFEKELVEIN